MEKKSNKTILDKHYLYEAAVQSVDHSMDFMTKTYRRLRGRQAETLREDFCGTAALAAAWAQSRDGRRAVGVDWDAATLAWARKHTLAPLSASTRERVHLVKGDVLQTRTEPMDVVCAFNFSYFIFKERPALKRYLENVRANLKPDGLFVCDIYGGSGAFGPLTEKRQVSARKHADGTRIPGFKYIWKQESFNAATGEVRCRIDFKLKGGVALKRAFTYDWRLWTAPEMRDVLADAGFGLRKVYTHGWGEDGESDDRYRARERFENEEGWLAYLVAGVS